MLLLGRKVGESISIDGGRIVVTIDRITCGQVTLGIEADKSIPVHRMEVQERIDREKGGACRT